MTTTRVEVETLRAALEQYRRDEGHLPGDTAALSPGRNDFPELYRALLGKRGPGNFYVYRVWRDLPGGPARFALYSPGLDGVDSWAAGEEGDDIGIR